MPSRQPAVRRRYNPEMLRRIESRPDWKIAFALTVLLRVFYSGAAAAFSFFLHLNPARMHSNALTENLPGPATAHYSLIGVSRGCETLSYLRIAYHGWYLAPAATSHSAGRL